MNKKNKGFTLVEVVATVAIIGIITVIATVTYTKVRRNIINREYENLKTLIEAAAVRYTAKTGKPSYYVEELIEEGYLEPDDDEEKIYDPRDDHPLNCHIVEVKMDEHGNFEATLRGKNYLQEDGCNPDIPSKYGLSITAKISGTSIDYINTSSYGSKLTTYSDNLFKNIQIYNNEGSRWTNKQLDVTATVTSDQTNKLDLANVRYIWNRNTDNTTTASTFTTTMYEFYNDYYYVDAYADGDVHLQGRFMYKFDKEKPVVYENKTRYADPSEENVWRKEKTLLIYVTDKDGVGIDKIYVGTRPCSDLLKDPSMGITPLAHSQVQQYTVREETGKDGENGKLNICAVDRLGNLSETVTFNAKKIDITPPQCYRSEGEHNVYQRSSRTIHQYCYDNNYINGKNVVGSQCTQDPFPKTWTTTTERDIITITDNVGWETDCTVDVYVDTTPPTCNGTSGEGATDNWHISDRTINQYCLDENSGCYENPFVQSWHRDEGTDSSSIITTDTMTIYDRAFKCSQTSTTSSNCSNYESIKGTDENNKNYRNETVCGPLGVYIDHVKPIITRESGPTIHTGRKARVSCSDDCNGNCSDYSDIKTFTASINGQTKSNTTGEEIYFNLNSSGTMHVTCEDNAGNIAETDLPFDVQEPSIPSNQTGSSGVVCNSNCRLTDVRTVNPNNCKNWGYDCYCQDVRCSSANNAGKGSSCCLGGERKEFGCKNVSGSDTPFGDDVYKAYSPYGTYPDVSNYMNYNGNYYKLPSNTKDDCYDDNGVTRCTKGRLCINYNCYLDAHWDSSGTVLDKICGVEID